MKRSHYFPWMGLIPLALGGCYVYSVAIPVVGTLLTVFLMGGLIALMLWGFSIDAEDAPPLPLLVVLVAIPGVVILGVLLAMIQRFREIEKGEAEDAKQY